MNGDIAHSDPEPPSLPRKVTIERGSEGYGFNLHGEKGIHGQYISAIDDGSPAQENDLRVGDRVIAVNNEDVEDFAHSKVVERIRAGGNQVILLVVDEQCDQYYKRLGLKIPQDRFEVPNVRPAQPAVVEENIASNDAAPSHPAETDQMNDQEHEIATEVPAQSVVVETPKVEEKPSDEVENDADDDGYEEVVPKATTESEPAEIPAHHEPEITSEIKPAEVAHTNTTTTEISPKNGSASSEHDSKQDMAAARPKPKRHDVKRATQDWKQKYDDFNKL